MTVGRAPDPARPSHKRGTCRLAIVQPYVAEYQRPFFELVEPALLDRDIETVVFHGVPSGGQASRADAVSPTSSRLVASRQLGLGPLRLDHKHTNRALRDWQPDLIVLEQAQRHVETYIHALHAGAGGPSIAFWGHGKAYHRDEGPLGSWLRQALTMRGDWFFAYTRTGADYIIDRGFSPSRVTVLGNTIDTRQLGAMLAAIEPIALQEFQTRLGLAPGRTALFLGGVDDAKGIPLLLEAADRVSARMPGFTLLIGGDGQLVPLVRARQAAGAPVRHLGRLSGEAKALALRAADVLAIPRSVGLVAVDSLVSGRPIVTTSATGHGPEFEYLDPTRTCTVSAPTVPAYATELAYLLSDTHRLATMQAAALADAPLHSLERMVESFVNGVTAWSQADHAGLRPARRLPRLTPTRHRG
jgi:glycosyltransferase involved in cell wall biosynthesis